MNQKSILRDIIRTTNEIRKKYRAIKTGRIESQIQLEDTFKPITKPLKELIKRDKDELKDEIMAELKN